MTPSQFHAALQSGQFVLQNGYYVYQGEDANETIYLTKAEGQALLNQCGPECSEYEDGAKTQEAKALAESSSGSAKPHIFGDVKAYVEKIGDKSTASNPLEDYETYQSIDVSVLEDPNATSEEKAYVKDILARKLKAAKYAQDNQDQLTDQQKADGDLLANTAVDEIDYAGPEVLEEIIAEGDTETKEAALVFTRRVVSGELDGEVNTISEEGKDQFAAVAYDFLKSDARHDIDPEIAEASYQAVVVYYSTDPQVADEQGSDLPHVVGEVGSSSRTGTDQADQNSFDDSLRGGNRLGLTSAGRGDAGETDAAGLVDPVALTKASLQEQNVIAANGSDTADSEAVPSMATASVSDSNDTESTDAPLVLSFLSVPAGDPILQYADYVLATRVSDSSLEMDFPARTFPTGVAAYYEPVLSGPAATQRSGDASLPVASAPGAYQVFMTESGALRVYGDTVTAVARRSEDRILDRDRRVAASERLNQVFFESPAQCTLDGGLCIWSGEIQDGDATTIAGLIATDPHVVGFAGMQSATVSTQYFVRGNTIVAVTGSKASLEGVAKKGESPNGGDHQGRDKEDGDHNQGQGGHSDDSRYSWYETPADEADDQSKAA